MEPETFVKRSFVFLNSLGVREFTSRRRRFKLKLRHLTTSLWYFGLYLIFLPLLFFLDYHLIPIKSHISPDIERKKSINEKPEPKIYLQSNLLINNLIRGARTTCTDIITGTGPWCNPCSFSHAVVNEQLATQPLLSTVPHRSTDVLQQLQAGSYLTHVGAQGLPGYIEVSFHWQARQTLLNWVWVLPFNNSENSDLLSNTYSQHKHWLFPIFSYPNRDMDNPALSQQHLSFASKPGSDSSTLCLLWGLQTLRFSLHWMSVQAEEIPYVFNPKLF